MGENRLDEALSRLNEYIAGEPESDEAYFMRGKVYWRIGDKRQALNDYSRAVGLNPESPAARALENARDVYDFFNPDIFNP
ncbi:MAG: tetratricopeptide repeat protein [Muribaculaceae bacterium]|nr:tetratricopeptide repeat protein [Muribaculaceae bacterium]